MKQKLSITIDTEKVKEIESLLQKGFFRNKSHILEFALIKFLEMLNWDEIKSDFIEVASKHNYVHLHMGTPNDMTHDLKNAGFEVVIAEDGKGITKKMIDLTDKIFRGRRR
ncbi:MAG TPA: hypothetical protein VJB35_05210 [Candidatus Nanoarchaeia archaeon]|nr:hypothetical protein [Candidatus Nanoarchaeia archaeon]